MKDPTNDEVCKRLAYSIRKRIERCKELRMLTFADEQSCLSCLSDIENNVWAPPVDNRVARGTQLLAQLEVLIWSGIETAGKDLKNGTDH